MPASTTYLHSVHELDIQRGIAQSGRYQIRGFSQINNMPNADNSNPIDGTGEGCTLAMSNTRLCTTGASTLHLVSGQVGLECPLSGPHADQYVAGSNCGPTDFTVGTNTFLSLSDAIAGLKAFHDANGGVMHGDTTRLDKAPITKTEE